MGTKLRHYCAWSLAVLIFFIGLCSVLSEYFDRRTHGEPRYEFVIAEKYKHIGNTYYFFGGRGTKEEYHVIYRYRLVNRPDNEANLIWYERDTEVDYVKFRSLKVGQRFEGSTPNLRFSR